MKSEDLPTDFDLRSLGVGDSFSVFVRRSFSEGERWEQKTHTSYFILKNS